MACAVRLRLSGAGPSLARRRRARRQGHRHRGGLGHISKEFGGAGMEGMEIGYDALRGVIAMGHSLLCAAVIARKRAVPLRLAQKSGIWGHTYPITRSQAAA